MRIAINGFGRIGRTFLRTILQDKQASKKIEVVAINIGPAQVEFAAHMFKYDTIMRTFQGDVAMRDNKLLIDDHSIEIIAETDPKLCKWDQRSIDWVVDASGAFTKREKAELHLKAGAQHVLITAPATDEDISVIPGINHNRFDAKKHKIVSLGSCTTNAFLPMLKVLNDNFGITDGFMTTVHAYTNSQKLLDVEDKSLRLSRAAALNIIPSTTGASKMIVKVLPELGEVIKASSLRVPVGIVSLIDLTVNVRNAISVAAINEAFAKAAESHLKHFVAITQEPLVSSDFIGNSHSVIIDGLSTDALNKSAKVLGWYDNEWGYSQRLKDFLLMIK
jgi:glyceraldehyde-3-phosphate dehydrogenase type I